MKSPDHIFRSGLEILSEPLFDQQFGVPLSSGSHGGGPPLNI